MSTMPGPGDPATWPAYSGHPNDPRGGFDGEPAIVCPWCGEDHPGRLGPAVEDDLCDGCYERSQASREELVAELIDAEERLDAARRRNILLERRLEHAKGRG